MTMAAYTTMKTRCDWSRIHDSEGVGLLTPPLAFLSLFYGLGVRLRVKAWERRKRESLPGFVLSIGNVTAGGTGKTPAAMTFARWAAKEGHRVAILSRGYRGRYPGETLEVTDGHNIQAGPGEAGDEPYLMATRLDGIPVILGRKRFLAGLHAHRRFRTDFFILDDGFQHIRLRRDLDLVLMDAARPFGNGHLLPWGPLREPLSHLARADAFLITKVATRETRESRLPQSLMTRFPAKPVFTSEHHPERVFFPNRKESHDLAYLRGKRVLAFVGIARPERFKETLEGLGAEILLFQVFDDHHEFTPGELWELMDLKERLHADCIVTTEKDWVRLKGQMDDPDLGYLTIRLDLGPDFDGLVSLIRDRLHHHKDWT